MNYLTDWINNTLDTLQIQGMIFVFFIYFIPSFLAYFNRHHNKKEILLLNFLLGWTGIVWLILTTYIIFFKPKNKHTYSSD